MDKFKKYQDRGILVMEDAAHGCGSYFNGEHVGTKFPAAFSFNVIKQVAAGEGGIISISDPEIAKKMKRLRWFGIDESTWQLEGKKYKWDYLVKEVGYKYHFNDILASIARVQLERLNYTNMIRRHVADLYTTLLGDLPILLPYADKNVKHSWHQYVIRVESKHRNELIDYLATKGISAGVHFKPINIHPIFTHGKTPVTDREWQKIITLPLHPRMESEDILAVSKAVHDFYAETVS